jgi:erythromycin esterase
LATPHSAIADLDRLLERIGDARYVLPGEASHGRSDHYRWRADISRRLIAGHGFSFVAVEGDWPDCFAVNQWVKSRRDQDLGVREVLASFERWPTWMWANEDVAEFAGWLRHHNLTTGSDVGFHGLDVHSTWDSLERIITFLGEHRPDALAVAHQALRCFEPYGEDAQRYAWATRMVPTSCEREVLDLLVELHRTPTGAR